MRNCHTCSRKCNIFTDRCIKCLELRRECNAENADLYNLFDKIYAVDCLIPSTSIYWSEITTNKEKTWKMIESQSASVKVLCELLKEANQNITPETRELIIQKVYLYVLSLCADLCFEGVIMFDNPGKYQFYYNKYKPLARSKDSAIKVLTSLKNADHIYKVFAGTQGIYASQIISSLDKSLLLFVEELHEPVRKLAEEFNGFFASFLQRWTEYSMSPGTDAIIDMWTNYLNIRNCLMPDVIQALNESPWKKAIDDQAEKQNNRFFMYEFLKRQKADTAAHEWNVKTLRVRYYLKTHPREKAKLEQLRALEIKQKQEIQEIRNRIAEMEEKKLPYSVTVSENAAILAEKEKQYKKLENRKITKYPVTDQLAALNKEMRNIQGIIDNANAKIAHYDKRIGFHNDDIQKMLPELEKLCPQRQQIKMDMEAFYRHP